MSEISCGFTTILDSHEQLSAVKLLVDSLRTYGGSLAACPVWIFHPNQLENDEALFGPGVNRIEFQWILILPETYNYPYNLHQQVSEDRRPQSLNELTTLV